MKKRMWKLWHGENLRRQIHGILGMVAAGALFFNCILLPVNAAKAGSSAGTPAVPPRQTSLADAERELNAAPLTPYVTGEEKCDAEVAAVLSQILTPGMTTAEKARACYDYVMDTCEYGVVDEDALDLNPDVTAYGAFYAASMLENHRGIADDYACALCALLRAIGLDSYVKGGTINGYQHTWSAVNVNGKEYIMDAMMGDALFDQSDAGTVRENRDYYYLTDPDATGDTYVTSGVLAYYFFPLRTIIAAGYTPEGFDPVFYAQTYPDVAAAIGTDPQALYCHYLTSGAAEGRLAHAE